MRIKRVSAVLALVLVLCLGACGKNESTVENTVEPDITIEETIETEVEPEVETEEPKEEIPVIYEDNELINLYLNRYNEVNTEAPIEREDFEVYYHHGREHTDQIIFNKDNKGEVVISDTVGKIEVVVDEVGTEENKQAFIKYAKGYSNSLSSEELEEYWVQAMNNATSYTQFEEFELYLYKSGDVVSYFSIIGKVE